MKIAFFHELPFGGARRVVNEFGKRLAKHYTVDLFYVDKEEDVDVSFFQQIFFFPFTSSEWSGKAWRKRLYKDTVELFRLAKLHKKIAVQIDKGGYDFVFVHPSQFTQAPFLLRFVKTPKIYFCQEPLRIVYDNFLRTLPKTSLPKRIYERGIRKLRQEIDKKNIIYANMILANSRFANEWIKRAYGRSSKVCYLGVDVDLFKPLEEEKVYDILFLGQKLPIEGYDLLEQALSFFRRKPKVKIIERGANGIGIDDQQLVEEYNKTKLVVCLSRNEPFGLTAIEAMSCGVPVVAIREGGFKESVVDGETGYLIHRNPHRLYRVLKKLFEDKELREAIGNNARAHVLKNWTWKKSIERFLIIVKQWSSR
ncbi:MAG: glycosyltransferase family 4 protein [Candidatus Levybacteria bacterium]|nr:glycosyltransferase family 4 protein [Candidatus Levybacteria bacterium]